MGSDEVDRGIGAPRGHEVATRRGYGARDPRFWTAERAELECQLKRELECQVRGRRSSPGEGLSSVAELVGARASAGRRARLTTRSVRETMFRTTVRRASEHRSR